MSCRCGWWGLNTPGVDGRQEWPGRLRHAYAQTPLEVTQRLRQAGRLLPERRRRLPRQRWGALELTHVSPVC